MIDTYKILLVMNDPLFVNPSSQTDFKYAQMLVKGLGMRDTPDPKAKNLFKNIAVKKEAEKKQTAAARKNNFVEVTKNQWIRREMMTEIEKRIKRLERHNNIQPIVYLVLFGGVLLLSMFGVI